MNRLLMAALASVVLAAPALAGLTTCPTGALTLYLVPNFSCQTGNLFFNGFGYTGTGIPSALAIPASAVTVTPVTTDGSEGFTFSASWNVSTVSGSSTSQVSTITFVVATPVPAITELHLFFDGTHAQTGRDITTENFCLNGSLQSCAAGNSGQISVTDPPPSFSNSAFFASVQSISVSDTISVVSNGNGTAATGNVTSTFDTPEPWTCVLMGSGLLGLGMLRRRRRTYVRP